MVKTKIYDNGLRLCFEKNDKNVVAVNILFNVGSANETESEQGYSHFIEHLLFKSSQNFSTMEIMDKLSYYGADFNAYTSRLVTRYIFKCLKENFEKCFEIYADMIIRPKFNADEIDKERNVVIEEMKKCDDDPVEVLYRTVMENYYSGNSYAHDELGTEEIISKVSRDELLAYKNKHYTANNCIISVAGNMEFDELDKIIEKYFVSCFEAKNLPYKVCKTEIEPNIAKKYDIVERDDNQANVCVHIKTVPAVSDKKYVSDLYASILGNSQNSRLYKIIREELGLVYSVYAFCDMVSVTGGIFIMLGTRPKNVKKAIFEIRKIIDEFAENGATKEEFERVKNLKKSVLEYSFETNQDVAEANGTMLHLYDNVKSIDERKQEIEKVTLDEINKFAKQISKETMFNVVAVGKNLNIEDLKQF